MPLKRHVTPPGKRELGLVHQIWYLRSVNVSPMLTSGRLKKIVITLHESGTSLKNSPNASSNATENIRSHHLANSNKLLWIQFGTCDLLFRSPQFSPLDNAKMVIIPHRNYKFSKNPRNAFSNTTEYIRHAMWQAKTRSSASILVHTICSCFHKFDQGAIQKW